MLKVARLRPVIFPAAVVIAFATLTGWALSGTSSGALWSYLYGSRPDPHLLLGQARRVRSDEWYVNTPMVLAQRAAGYPVVNHRLGTGANMSLVFDLPYHDWSLAFRPQSWGYLFLPDGQAFAFKWWLPALVLLLGGYAAVLAVLPGRRLLAALLSLGVLFSPFCQWWFSSSTLGALGWSLAAVATFHAVLTAPGWRRVLLASVLLAYECACFGLLLYPPFQIPCALVALALCVGLLLNRLPELGRRQALLRVAATGGAVAAAGVALVLFVVTRSDAIHAVTGTSYPGHRHTDAGGFSGLRMLYGVLTPALSLRTVTDLRGAALGGNQSEASAFLLIGIFLLPVQLWLLFRARRASRPRDPVLTALLVLLGVFMADLFLTAFNPVASVLLLSYVPHNRLHIGLGLLSTALIVATVRELRRQAVRPPLLLLLGTGLFIFLISIAVAYRVRHLSPSAPGGRVLVLLGAALCAGAVVLLAAGRAELGAGTLLVFCLLGAGTVNPLYRGVFDTRDTPVGRAIHQVDTAAPGGWASTADLLANAVLVESGVHTYSGTFAYPEPGQWALLDPSGSARGVYNRYAQVVFTNEVKGAPLVAPQPDVIHAYLDPCAPFAQQRLRHILSSSPLTSKCARLNRAVPMPGTSFLIYDVVATS